MVAFSVSSFASNKQGHDKIPVQPQRTKRTLEGNQTTITRPPVTLSNYGCKNLTTRSLPAIPLLSSFEEAVYKQQQKQRQHQQKNPKKSVRFADVFTVEQFEKEEQVVLDSLFWTRNELYESYEDERDEIAAIQSFYGEALWMAYKQSSQAASSDVSIDLDYHHEQQQVSLSPINTATARGLELDIFPPIKKYTLKHRRVVLLLQESLRRKYGDDLSNYTCLKLLQQASRQYSRPCRIVAKKLGQLDSMQDDDDSDATDWNWLSDLPRDKKHVTTDEALPSSSSCQRGGFLCRENEQSFFNI
ncbi:hypothetical protein ACA910_018557 [Epithemia clementina (nom. ined.)]